MSDDALTLAFRAGLPFAGLRDHEHDPELDRIIPPDVARAARALPLAADRERVRLAVADPERDLSPLSPYLADRRVELTIADRAELEAILGPPPAAREPAPAEPAQPAEPPPRAQFAAPTTARPPAANAGTPSWLEPARPRRSLRVLLAVVVLLLVAGTAVAVALLLDWPS